MSVHMHYMIIGKNICECRKALHLSQEALAENAGICQQFLSRLERGKGVPSLETIMSLCDALNVEPNRLLTRGATHNSNPPCRLRSEDDFIFCEDYEDSEDAELIVIRPEDLPIVDLELPDTELDLEDI